MRVFVTGATGFVGSAIVRDLLDAGHRVTGLARSETAAARLKALGVKVHPGALDEPEGLARGAEECDGVIHTAFNHEFKDFQHDCAVDRQVILALGEVLAGSGRPLVVTSGTAIVAGTRLAKETDMPAQTAHAHPRAASEQEIAGLTAKNVRAMVMRLPPTVHGEGDHGFVPMMIAAARAKGLSAYAGEGQNVWPAVHRFDAARLYRLALEQGKAGANYHAVAESGIAFKQIAEATGHQLQVPIISKMPDELAAIFGWLSAFVGLDNPTSSSWTRQTLGWTPTHPGLLDDLQHAGYFSR